MKKLVNKLISLGFVGLFSLSSCSTFQKSFSQKKGYKNWMALNRFEDNIILVYDSDGDGVEDLREIFRVKDVYDTGALYLELISIAEDSNRDGIFSEDEYKIINNDHFLGPKKIESKKDKITI